MNIELVEQMINEALKDRDRKVTSFKYELNIGDYPIAITMGIN